MEQQTVNLQALFLEHAGGMFTRRALEERRVRILKNMSANKYNMSEETFKELTEELAEIDRKLGEV